MAPEDDDIEGIDRKLIELIAKRADVYIGALKGRPADKGLFRPEDRSRIFKLIEEINQGPLPNQVLEKVYTEMISGSVSAVAQIKVAFLGPEGSFTAEAVKGFFGDTIAPLQQKTIQDVFLEVETGKAQFGVVPVENSTEGSVTYTLDELTETSLYIQSEQYLRVSYYLMSKSKDISSVKKIYAHPQTMGQCKGWLRANLPEANLVSVESTSRSAELAAGEAGAAAIASELAADIYRLNILAEKIEDARQNYTRFFLIGSNRNAATGNDKTSIVCAVKDRPGALLDLLRPFAEGGINMTKIESRPDKKKMWEYYFFIDVAGHQDDSVIKAALEKIKDEAVFLKILGSYPVGN